MKNFLIAFLLVFNFSKADIIIAYAKSSNQFENNIDTQRHIEVDKLEKIAKQNNINISFKALPWKRALLMLEKGKIDGVINASYKINRAEYAHYPMIHGKPDESKRLNDGNSYFIYKHIDSPLRWNGEKFLRGGSIAVMSSYAVIEDLKKHDNISIQEYHSNTEIIRKLSNKKVDGYAGTKVLADELLAKYPSLAKNIVRESLPIRKKSYFLIFSKTTYKEKSKDMEKIWQGLKEINQ